MGNGRATPTDWPEFTVQTGTAACPVFFGLFACIDITQGLTEDVANQGGEFAAGMHFTVGENRDEIEGRATAEAGAPAG